MLLGEYTNLRDVQVAPGGGTIAFYLPFQENPADSGVYVQRTTPGSLARKLPFFGAYRWRDDRWLYTLSFDASQDAHALGLADALTGAHRWLTDPETLPSVWLTAIERFAGRDAHRLRRPGRLWAVPVGVRGGRGVRDFGLRIANCGLENPPHM